MKETKDNANQRLAKAAQYYDSSAEVGLIVHVPKQHVVHFHDLLDQVMGAVFIHLTFYRPL